MSIDILCSAVDLDRTEDLYEHFSINVDNGQSLLRIDKFLVTRIENRSRSKIQAALDTGSVVVNGKSVKPSYKVKPEDNIVLVLPYPRRSMDVEPENLPLDIVYEDDDLLIVNKVAGMVVHPGFNNYTGTLVNALTYYLQDLPLFKEGDIRAGLVHRIDKNTSGLLVIAKNEYTHVALAKQFFDHTTERTYHALVWGTVANDSGTITGRISRSEKDRLRMCVLPEDSPLEGKHAVTHYAVLERFDYVTLVECRLETGRTHQIRTHFEHLGHPLFNDDRYGGNKILRGTTHTKYKQFVDNCFKIMPRQGLHALSLGFIHPKTKQKLNFSSDYPKDLADCINKWRDYVSLR